MKNNFDYLRAALLLLAFLSVPFCIGSWRPEPMYWNAALWKDAWVWAAAFALVALAVGCFKRHRAVLLLGLLLLYLGWGVGARQSLAVLYCAASAYALGRVLLWACYRRQRGLPLLLEALLLGTASYTALFAAMLHFTVNYPAVYALLLALPFVAALRCVPPSRLAARAAALPAQWSRRLARLSYWQLAPALCVIGYLARFAFYPSLGYDDNALHLRIWSTLANNHVYDFDAGSQVWAVAPFTVDLLAAVPSVLAGANARGAFNLGLLALLLHGMWELSRLLNRRGGERLLVLALFATTPLVYVLLAVQQTELFLSVLATLGTLLVLRRSSALDRPAVATLTVIAALCCGTKLNAALLGLTLLAALACRVSWRRAGAQLRRAPGARGGLALALSVGAAVAFHAYLYAWWATGNPVLPLYNGVFKSPYFDPVNFVDTLYSKGASLTAYWELFFNTTAHLEAGNYTGGFQYALFFPLGLLMLAAAPRRRQAALLLLPLLGFGVGMFFVLQYVRYLFPVVPLAALAIGAVLAAPAGARWRAPARAGAVAALLLCGAVNLFYMPGIMWYFSTPPKKLFTEAGRQELVKDRLPEQYLNQYLNRHSPGARVLYEVDRPFGATLAALPVYLNWYSMSTARHMWGIHTAQDMAQFLRAHQVGYVYWDFSQPGDDANVYRGLLRRQLNAYGVPELRTNNIVAYRLQDQLQQYKPAVAISDFSGYRAKPDGQAAPAPAATPALPLAVAPLFLREFDTGGASAFRYRVVLDCPAAPAGAPTPAPAGFVAQINWDRGESYFRFVKCRHDGTEFVETFPVPAGATKGSIFASRQEGPALVLKQLDVELK